MLWKYKVAKEFKIKPKADTLAVKGMKVEAWIFTCAVVLGSSCQAVKDTIAGAMLWTRAHHSLLVLVLGASPA